MRKPNRRDEIERRREEDYHYACRQRDYWKQREVYEQMLKDTERKPAPWWAWTLLLIIIILVVVMS